MADVIVWADKAETLAHIKAQQDLRAPDVAWRHGDHLMSCWRTVDGKTIDVVVLYEFVAAGIVSKRELGAWGYGDTMFLVNERTRAACEEGKV